jgi:hypothetical protein
MPSPPIRGPVRKRSILLLAGVVLAAALWAGWTWSIHPERETPPASESPYVGAAVCAECHAETFRRQSASHHALTLVPAATRGAVAGLHGGASLDDRATGIAYHVATRNGQLYEVLSRNGKETGAARMDYLLGSGHHGISPMGFDGTEWRYLALTYYATKGWDFSPMHQNGDAHARLQNAAGWPVSVPELQKCFGCHSTRVEFAGSRIDAAQTELGVHCEACHGPGRTHVEAARKRSADPAITNPRKWSTTSFLALCRQCHNENSTLDGTLFGIPKDPRSPGLAKFQVYEMEQSRCFKQSGGAMRCTTCHDPHGDTEPSPAFYTDKCLGCHQPHAAGQTACPVSPKGACISCHMPQVQVEKHTYFADHWIRARSPFAPRARPASEAAGLRSASGNGQ